MRDEELIRFAENESLHLTIESFNVLANEFERRNLDISLLERTEEDRPARLKESCLS